VSARFAYQWLGKEVVGPVMYGLVVYMPRIGIATMIKFILWCILFVFCWPLALAALVLYPLVWLFLLPFRIVGIAVDGVLQLVSGIILLPARLLRAV
jgi:hypothetical protein